MTKIYCVEGKQNSGKTTVIWAVYQCLAELFKDKNPHMFQLGNGEGWIFQTMQLVFNKYAGLRDFQAVFVLDKIKIGIISAGDFEEVLRKRIEEHINEYGVDILICAHRSTITPINNILTNVQNAPKQCVFTVKLDNNPQARSEAQSKDIIESLLNRIVENVNKDNNSSYLLLECKFINDILHNIEKRIITLQDKLKMI